MAPIVGQAWVAYVPSGRVVGISKLARVVEVFQTFANSGKDDGSDRQYHQRCA